MATKYVYLFGGGTADGHADMKNLLGGKGANLAEMASLGIPVPPGFTITTEVCTIYYNRNKQYPSELEDQMSAGVSYIEKIMGSKFGDPDNALLVSVRSGARRSMPGMMETVLNVGLTTKTIPGLIKKTNNERFVYDAYRRLITMYSDVVMEKAAGIEPEERKGIRQQLEVLLDAVKEEKGYTSDTDLTAQDLKVLCEQYKAKVQEVLGKPFPDEAMDQLWGAIGAVFQSWKGRRAISYRRIEGIPDDWGTAVNVQAMVFGNMGDHSATGVAFTRNPATGENRFYGEWLVNAQGEDVVAGIRTPNAINEAGKTETNKDLPSLEGAMSKLYRELHAIRDQLEQHYTDMQDIEFTIQEGRLWMLQTRVGKRNGPAALKMAVEMCNEGLIGREVAVSRVKPGQIDELLHPMVNPVEEQKHTPLAKGLPAGPGGATGKIALTADRAEEKAKKGEKVILVRTETSPEDVHGMHAAEAILTARGGMTSHAALVARGWGKCCIVGCGALDIQVDQGVVNVNGKILREGDVITLNGTKGLMYEGELPLIVMDPEKNPDLRTFLGWCDEIRTLGIRTNADRPEDATQARTFGAEGIGLCRTEHMFFGEDRIKAMREMILADDEKGRRRALAKLLPMQKSDFIGIFRAMEGLPVTIRLLDPPLHEFVPHEEANQKEMAEEMGVSAEEVRAKVVALHEFNPMLGHRGCRLGMTYPEISEIQARAIFEAACELTKEGVKVLSEVMIPLVGTTGEMKGQKEVIDRVAKAVMREYGVELEYLVGTMVEIPRAALVADKIAEDAAFFSFGTNDLTQMTFGYSRDDAGKFLPAYVDQGVLSADPFQTLDQEGVGQLIEVGIQRGRSTRPDLKVGICGEHGGDPRSIAFCHRVGMNYVSCSPFRVPIARLAAAQAVIEEKQGH